MSSIGLIVMASFTLTSASFQVSDKDAKSPITRALEGNYIIAQQYDGNDPHGYDPHGIDPHSESHDLGLPANSNSQYPATTDVTGGTSGTTNSSAPYSGS